MSETRPSFGRAAKVVSFPFRESGERPRVTFEKRERERERERRMRAHSKGGLVVVGRKVRGRKREKRKSFRDTLE